jgi:hypothetical protein
MQRGDVNEMNLIALSGKPAGMTAWPATDIQDRGRWRRKKPLEKLTRAFTVKVTCALMQSVSLVSGVVVISDCFRLRRK